MRKFTALAAAALLLATACSSSPQTPADDEPQIIDADDALTHEELQSEDYGPVINYGNHGFVDGPLHDVIVDGKKRKSIFTQKSLDMAERTSITREEYEGAFLDFVACIEDRGGWIHYDLKANIINYTMTSGSDPHDYCFNSHFNFAMSAWRVPMDYSENFLFLTDCLDDNAIEPVHTEPGDPGPTQWLRIEELERQVDEEGVECGDFIESFYENAPYPE